MSQGQPGYPQRNAFATSSKLPDRTYTTATDNTAQQNFARSAYSRRPEGAHHPQQRAQLAPQYGQPVGPARTNMGKENEHVAVLTDDQRAEIDEAFTLFDVSGIGMLSFQETRVAFRALGFKISRPDIKQMMETWGVISPVAEARRREKGNRSENYHVSNMVMPYAKFVQLAAARVHAREPEEEVERAFNLFDQDRKGYIIFEDLQRVAHELGETGLEDEELHAMINEFDFEGTGSVARETFFSILMG